MDAVRLRPTPLNATARRGFLPARRVATRRLPCGSATCRERERRAVYACRDFGKTRNPVGTWAAVFPWRRLLVHGDLHTVPSDGAANRRFTVRQPADMGSVSRPAARAFQRRPQAPPGGVQPHRFAGAAERPCRRAAGNGLGVAAQQRRQGGGVQPPRLAITARQRRQYKRSGY